MLTATIASLLADKANADNARNARISNKVAETAIGKAMLSNLGESVRVVRERCKANIEAAILAEKAEAARKEREAKLAKERTLKAKAARIARNRRDAAIAIILANSRVALRKDGSRYLRSNPGKADVVKVAMFNAAHEASKARPEHGYPCPPPRRSDAYPAGGLWGKPQGMTDIEIKRGEMARLSKYAEACYNAERPLFDVTDGEVGKVVNFMGEPVGGVTLETNNVWVACPTDVKEPVTLHKTYVKALTAIAVSPRVRRMVNHLSTLQRQIKVLGSEQHVRKAGKHCYAKVNDPRQTING